nr:hypothetical protein [uncultured Draconibacterium sp.]
MKNFKQKFISAIVGGLAFYATTWAATPMAMWIKFGVFIIVSLIVYFLIKPNEK